MAAISTIQKIRSFPNASGYRTMPKIATASTGTMTTTW